MRWVSTAIACILLLTAGVAYATNTNSAGFTSTANKNLQASDSATISITSTLTVQYAVKLYGTPIDQQGLIGNYSAAGNSDRAYFCQREVDNKITCGVFSGSSRFDVTSATALTANTWYCLVFKYIPSTSLTIYLDADCDATPAQDGQNTTSIPASINNSTANFTLGAFTAFASTAGNVLYGGLDDVRIWNGNHDFTSDYNCQLTSPYDSSLNVYWTLNNTLNDATGNGNTLTNNGSVDIASTSVPFSSDCAAASTGGFKGFFSVFWW